MENKNQEIYENSALSETVPDELLEHATPNNPPWNILHGIGLWIVSVMLIAIVPVFFLIPYIFQQQIDINDSAVLSKFFTTDQTALMLQIAAIIPAHLLTLVLAWFIVTKFNKYSFTKTLGWNWGGYKWWQIALGTITILLSVLLVANITTYQFGTRTNAFMELIKSSRNIVFLVAFMATFTAPIVEEVVYRGVFYSAVQKSLNIPIAVISTTLIFAMVHYPQYWGDPATIITLTFLSLVLTMVRVWTNNLLPCIFLHFVFNGIQSLVLIFEPYLPKSISPDLAPVESFIMLFK